MNVRLYKNTSDVKVLTKQITFVTSKDCTLKENVSIENPAIILNVDAATLAECNYMYLDEVKRYYYITDTTLLTGGRWQVTGKVDVLMSFNAQIKNLMCIIDKQANINNASLFIDDGDFVMENRTFNEVLTFPNSLLTTGEFILITAGGQGN